MKLMTKALEQEFEQIGMQRDIKDPQVITKYFHPLHPSATWYASEYNPETRNFYGFVEGLIPGGDEWGYFSLDELESINMKGLKMERDLFHIKQPISKCCHSPFLNTQPSLSPKREKDEIPKLGNDVDIDI
ncbi:MAG: DUF2958 domain-containing protein [Flavobacteriales bacterium]